MHATDRPAGPDVKKKMRDQIDRCMQSRGTDEEGLDPFMVGIYMVTAAAAAAVNF
jgi:hypothetical protein